MDILMPQLGETVQEGTITVWHKKPGDNVAEGEVLFDVSTDKVDTEVPAPAAGTLTEIAVSEGETVKVGTRLGAIDDGSGASAPAAEPAAEAESGGGVDVVMPQLGETVQEGTITVWHKKPGDEVTEGEVLFDVSTDKVDTEVQAPATGTLSQIIIGEGETVKVGTALARIGGAAGAASPASASAPSAPTAAAPAPAAAAVPDRAPRNRAGRLPKTDSRGNPLSPVVRRLIAQHGLNADDIAGSGARGRIKKRDVEAFLAAGGAASPSARPTPAPMPKSEGGKTVIPFNKIRKLTAEHMVRSKATSPHVLQAVEANFHRIETARAAAKDAWKAKEGFSLTYMPFIARAVCLAIADFPRVNAHIEGENLVVYDRVGLGIAVDLDFEGLVAPVVRDADSMSLPGLARAIRDVADRARSNTLNADDFAGGTYTISNSGVFGTMITAPIINQPQVAIISTDGVQRKPVVVDTADGGEAIAIRPVGVLAQSFDHRAIDGAYSATYLNRLREIIETHDWAGEV